MDPFKSLPPRSSSKGPDLPKKLLLRYLKVKAHAERGVGHEQEVARVKLTEMEAEYKGIRRQAAALELRAADLVEATREEGEGDDLDNTPWTYPGDPRWRMADPPRGFDPSPDQRAAVERLIRAVENRRRGASHAIPASGFPVLPASNRPDPLVLAGPAGSGKTTIMRWFASIFTANGWAVEYLAPTGKAASRLRTLTGAPYAFTIHGALYEVVNDIGEGKVAFKEPHPPCESGTLVIVDEASMVDQFLHNDLVSQLPEDTVLLYVGDREQLPPVGGTWGPNFTNPTATLETVHRQAAGNPILGLASSIRNNQPFDWSLAGDAIRVVAGGPFEDAVSWIIDHLDGDATAITWTNDQRKALNARTRVRLGRQKPFEAGDMVVVRANNRHVGVMNGEVYRVEEARLLPRGAPTNPLLWELSLEGRHNRTILVMEAYIGVDRGDFYAQIKTLPRGPEARAVGFPSYRMMEITHVDYGYCLTGHVSQGSDWKDVLFILDAATERKCNNDRDFGRRFLYTCVTRARETLTWWRLP